MGRVVSKKPQQSMYNYPQPDKYSANYGIRGCIEATKEE